jgi:thymidylate synthase (FAD)
MATASDIRVIRTPSVYVLGRQTVDDAELDRFLTDHGVAWQSDSEIASEVLCETAGRACYMSYARPRPGGNAAYLHHIKESGHGSVLEHAVCRPEGMSPPPSRLPPAAYRFDSRAVFAL